MDDYINQLSTMGRAAYDARHDNSFEQAYLGLRSQMGRAAYDARHPGIAEDPTIASGDSSAYANSFEPQPYDGNYVEGTTSEQESADQRANFIDQFVGAFTGENQRQLQQLQQAAARAQYEFEERMSSTAYQRAVKDMKAAGLNPAVMFASQNASSASTPQVGIAQVATENQMISMISAASQVTNSIGNMLKAISSLLPSAKLSQLLPMIIGG